MDVSTESTYFLSFPHSNSCSIFRQRAFPHFKEPLYFFYAGGRCTRKLKPSTASDEVRVHIVNSVCRCYGTHFHFRSGEGESVRRGDCPCVAIVIKMPRNPTILHCNFCVLDHTKKLSALVHTYSICLYYK